jgi:transposase
MPPVDRKNPVRAKSSESSFSVMEFMQTFPDDDACLSWLWRTRYSADGETAHCPRCGKQRTFRHYTNKTRTRQVWTCTSCSLQISPTAGTIFHKSSTSLHLWFYAMWIMTSTRCGVSAKQLERELGVTYKTAWRMFNKIRNELMTQDYQGPLGGTVEADETWIGGKMRQSEINRRRREGQVVKGPYAKHRETVFSMVQRGGQVVAIHVPSRYGFTLRGHIGRTVLPDAIVYTDDAAGYNGLERFYSHGRVNHSHKVYVDGDVHTQTIEGFFSLVKNGIRGVYHVVSAKWLQGYLNEYAWRYNHRDDGRAMFLTLLLRAAEPTA